jgi:NhaP-type Na+/H+ and K+/H+ antiporter
MAHENDSHGSTPAAWTLVTIVMIASVVGAIGIVSANYALFWVGVGLVVVGLIVGKVMQMMGLGQAPKQRPEVAAVVGTESDPAH